MGLFGCLSRVARANLNEMMRQSANPEEVLDRVISDLGLSLQLPHQKGLFVRETNEKQ